MASLFMSPSGVTALTKDEGAIDGLYNDQSGYCTYGVGHLVHPTDKWGCFLLAAAQASDTWKPKLVKTLNVTNVPRSAVSWSDWAEFQSQAVNLGQDVVAKKRHGKDFSQLTEAEKATVKSTAEAVVREEANIMSKTPAEILKGDIGTYEAGVNAAITGVTLTQEEYDALVSLTFNIGVANFRSSSVARKINENKFRTGGDINSREAAIADIERAFLAWNKSGGVVLAVLTSRRKGEASRFLKGARQEVTNMRLKISTVATAAAMRTHCAPK
jgi:lysozyme